MSQAAIYSVKELLELELKLEPLIDKILWKRDNVFLIAHEKVGKSILALQMACALSSGQTFLGEYTVIEATDVLYIQVEGKLAETKNRIESMLKVNDCDQTRVHIAFLPAVALDTVEGFNHLVAYIDSKKLKPKVIIIDPLYQAMEGDLIDNRACRQMTKNLRYLSDMYDATMILVHHTHRPVRFEGRAINEGDDALFGSFVWKAWPDHILLIELDKRSKIRVLSCNTQRSNNIMEKDELILTDKPGLSFERKEDEGKPYELKVRRIVEAGGKDGWTREEIGEKSGLSMSSVDKSLRKLMRTGEIERENKRPVKYRSSVENGTETPNSGRPESAPADRAST